MASRASDWWRQAQRDLAHARNALEDRDFEWSCFAAKQAAEKAVKAVLDCVRNEPQSEPFVGQARLSSIESIFFGGCADLRRGVG